MTRNEPLYLFKVCRHHLSQHLGLFVLRRSGAISTLLDQAIIFQELIFAFLLTLYHSFRICGNPEASVPQF